MPIFTMIISLIALPFTCIFDKVIIEYIAMLIGIIADIIFQIVLVIKDKNKPESEFIIDYRRTGYNTEE